MTKTSPLPEDSAERKRIPLCTGLLDYFSAALAAVATHSLESNEKHNPGEPMHWARGKSMDHPDCLLRHLVDARAASDRRYHLTALAWRALAMLQEELESHGAPTPPAARPVDDGAAVAAAAIDPSVPEGCVRVETSQGPAIVRIDGWDR